MKGECEGDGCRVRMSPPGSSPGGWRGQGRWWWALGQAVGPRLHLRMRQLARWRWRRHRRTRPARAVTPLSQAWKGPCPPRLEWCRWRWWCWRQWRWRWCHWSCRWRWPCPWAAEDALRPCRGLALLGEMKRVQTKKVQMKRLQTTNCPRGYHSVQLRALPLHRQVHGHLDRHHALRAAHARTGRAPACGRAPL